MKNIKLPANLSRSLNGLAFKMKKHAPEILVVAGVGGTIATSSNDITTTRRMEETGVLVGIRMLDHVIIAEDNCYSVCTNRYIREEN